MTPQEAIQQAAAQSGDTLVTNVKNYTSLGWTEAYGASGTHYVYTHRNQKVRRYNPLNDEPIPVPSKTFSVWNGNTIAHQTVLDIAQSVAALCPDPTWALEWFPKAGEGGTWQSTWDSSPLAIDGPSSLSAAVAEFRRYHIRLVPYVVIRGRPEWRQAEQEQIRQCVFAAGMCILNLEPGPEYWNGPTDTIGVQAWFGELNVPAERLWLCAIPRQWCVNTLGGDDVMRLWTANVAGVSWECLAPSSRVLTTDLRWVRLGDCKPGDRLLSFDDAGLRPFSEGTIERLRFDKKACYRVITEVGDVIASAGHPWMSEKVSGSRNTNRRHWVRTDQLAQNQQVVYWGEPWTDDTNHAAGYLAGFLDGEGCVTAHHYGVGYTQLPGVVLDRVRRLMYDGGYPISAMGTDPRSGCIREHVHGMYHALRLLGRVRPSRLLPKAPLVWSKLSSARNTRGVRVLAVEPVGEREIVQTQVTNGTMIADGFLMHNCYEDAPAPDLAPGVAIERAKAWVDPSNPWNLIPVIQRSMIDRYKDWPSPSLQVWQLDGN